MQEIKETSYDGWLGCPVCKNMYHELEETLRMGVCPKCDHHAVMSVKDRVDLLADEGSFQRLFEEYEAEDLLGFCDQKSYVDRLSGYRSKTNETAAVVVGRCKMDGVDVALGVMNFSFMGGSLGRAEGERITSLIEYATDERLPLVLVNASGGARMQESMYSLMQMAKTSQALKRHQKSGGLYISVLTHPTFGGVSASFAFLGDVILAEPKAMIGFSGPRVIEQTIGEKLKETDQKAEFHLDAGMVDQIVHRKDLKKKISYFIRVLAKKS